MSIKLHLVGISTE